MFLRFLAIFTITIALFACGHAKTKGRYISETDTAFNKDIRDASAKINKDPNNAELYYKRGNAFYYLDKFKDAAMDLQTAVEIDSLNAMYHFRLGETILKLDTADSRMAKMHLQKAVALQPTFNEARLLLAKYFIARQDYEQAETLLKALTDITDMSDKAFTLLGVCKKEQKDSFQAVVYFEKALQVNPQNYDAAMQIANIKAAENDPKAMNFFDRVLAINEYSDEAFYGKGLLLQKQNKYKDALACYIKASQINAGHRFARYNTAVIYSLFEDWDNAHDWCDKTLDIDPKNANALALRGYTSEKTGNKKAAIADYDAALEIDPFNAPAIAGLKSLGRR